MAISYVGGQVSGRAGATGATSVTFALTGGSNSTPQAGDFVLVTAVVGSAGRNPAQAITTPTGYIALGQLNQAAATYDTCMNVSYKFMGTTPDTTVTIPGTGSNQDGQAWTIQVFRGVGQSRPMDVTPVSAGGTGTSRPDPGSITPVTNGALGPAWVVICGGGAASLAANYIAPANFTTNFLTTALGIDTNDALVGSGYWSGWTSGAVDPDPYTGGSNLAADSWASYTIALRPGGPLELISTFQENFDAPLNPDKWDNSFVQDGSVTFENGIGSFVYTSTVNGTHASLLSVDSFIFKDSSVYYKVERVPDWGASNPAGGEFSFTLESAGDNRIDWTIYSNNTLALIKFTNNAWASIKEISANFRPVKDTYRWLRFRETSGTTYFESAPSTASNPPIAGDWVIQHSALTSSFPINALNVKIVWRLWISNPVAGIANPMPGADGLNTASGAPPAGETIPVPLLTEVQTLLLPVVLAAEAIAVPKLTEVQTLRLPNILTAEIIAVPKLTETQTLLLPTINAREAIAVPKLTETQTLLLPIINAREAIAVPKLTEIQTLLLPNILTADAIAVPLLTEVQTLHVPTIISIVTDIVLVPVLIQTQTLFLPAVNALGTPVSLYVVDDQSFLTPTVGTKAAFLPKAANTAATGAGPLDSSVEGNLSTFWGGTGNIVNRTVTITATGDQSYYFGRFSSKPLAAQTIPTQTWNWAAIVGEGNLAANTFIWPVMYVWRPGVGKVLPAIFDASAPAGIELVAAVQSATRSFVGAQTTTQEGDILVVECWLAGNPTSTGHLQTWRITSNGSFITSPYKIEFKPDTILYFQQSAPVVVPAKAVGGLGLPLALNTNQSASATEGLLSTTLIQAPVGRYITAPEDRATTSQQSYFFGRYSSGYLASQTIPAQTWGWEVSSGEQNAASNTFHWPVLYAWRPTTNSLVGYIFDGTGPYGIEWRANTDPLLNQKFVGPELTIQNGDILVVEIWGVAQHTTAVQYEQNVWVTAINASIVSPYVIIPGTAAPSTKRRIFLIT